MKKTIVINLFGGPGAAKSTIASYIFSQLKMMGVNCELITEFAKDLTWEDNTNALYCQEYVFGNQSYRQFRVKDKVDVIITDSPLILNCIYNTRYNGQNKNYDDVVKSTFDSYDNMNFYLQRETPYVSVGRNESEKQAKDIDNEIKCFLLKNLYSYQVVNGNIEGGEVIIKKVVDRLKEEDYPLLFELNKV